MKTIQTAFILLIVLAAAGCANTRKEPSIADQIRARGELRIEIAKQIEKGEEKVAEAKKMLERSEKAQSKADEYTEKAKKLNAESADLKTASEKLAAEGNAQINKALEEYNATKVAPPLQIPNNITNTQ